MTERIRPSPMAMCHCACERLSRHCDAQRYGPAAAESGSDVGADAVGSRLQPIVRPRRASTIQDLTPLCRTLFRLARSVQCSGMTSQLADAYLARDIFRVGVGPAEPSPPGDPP